MDTETWDLIKLYSCGDPEEIKETLLERGYTKEQIKYIDLGVAVGMGL